VDELGHGIELEAPAAEGIVGGVDVGDTEVQDRAPRVQAPGRVGSPIEQQSDVAEAEEREAGL
jgi:hypothetical protein